MDLVGRVAARRETTWETYADAVVLVLAMEMVQLRVSRPRLAAMACAVVDSAL
jgi:hypothetical protein